MTLPKIGFPIIVVTSNMADENREAKQWGNVTSVVDRDDCEGLKTLLRKDCLDEYLALRSPDGDGKTVLHYAVERGSTGTVETLLAEEGDCNLQYLLEERDNSDKTPLHTAVEGNLQDMVDILLNAGADPLCRDHREKTAVQLAFQMGYWNVVELLVDKVRDGTQNERLNDISFDLLQVALTNSQKKNEDEKEDDAIASLEHLFTINAIPNINQSNPRITGSTRTALCTAFDLNYQRVLVWLLKRGAYVNFDHEGKVLNLLTADKMAELLDYSITLENSGADPQNSSPDSKNCRLRLDYSFLMPPSETRAQNELKPLMFLCRERPSEAIRHPLLALFMAAKWSKLSTLYHFYRFIKSFLSCFFSFLLTAYTSNELECLPNNTCGQATLRCVILIVYILSAIIILMQLRFTYTLVKPLQLRSSKHPAIAMVLELGLVFLVLLMIVLWQDLPVRVTQHLAAWVVMATW